MILSDCFLKMNCLIMPYVNRRRYHKRLETSPYRTICRADFLDDPRSLVPHMDTSLLPPELRRPLGKRRRPAVGVANGARRAPVKARRDTGGGDDGAAEALLGEDGLGPVALSADEMRREEGDEEGGAGAGAGADGEAAEGEAARRGSDAEGDDWEEGEEEEGDMEMADYAVGKVHMSCVDEGWLYVCLLLW